MIAQHSCPILEGEDILEHPKSSDPRVSPWIEHLIELGVMDRQGNFLKSSGKIRKGVGPEGYLWEVEWE